VLRSLYSVYVCREPAAQVTITKVVAMRFSKALAYAWHGSGRRWDALWLALIGGLIGGFVIWRLGLTVPHAILDNPGWGGVAAIMLGAFTGVMVVFVARLCWWPFHWRLQPHGGLNAFLGANLGAFMWPIILTVSGFLAFVLLTGIGVIWLSLQAIHGGSTTREATTPNTIGSPDFALFIPQGRYRFSWPAPNTMAFYLRLDSERNPNISNNPAFILRNRTNTVAYRVVAEWKSETPMNIEEVVKSSPRLARAQFVITDTTMTIISKPDMPLGNFQFYLDPAPKQTVPVIAKEEEIYLPITLWPLAAVYFSDKMPDGIGETSPPFIALVSLNWEPLKVNAKILSRKDNRHEREKLIISATGR
jgi:hypothetical protein